MLCWKAAENLPAKVSEAPAPVLEVRELLPCRFILFPDTCCTVCQLVHFFASKVQSTDRSSTSHSLVALIDMCQEQKLFLLGHCPQAVALALLLEAEMEEPGSDDFPCCNK